jgi:hypothetical protein
MPIEIKPKTRKAPIKKRTIKKPIAPAISFVPTQPITMSKKSHSSYNYWIWLAWTGAIMVITLTVSTSAVLFCTKPISKITFNPQQTKNTTIPSLTIAAPLTGQQVTPDVATRRPWAVVIGNLPAARPQTGLNQADVVIEAPAEAGITRYLAIYQSQLPEKIGGIRSARPYFNDWASAFGALYSHSGGSAEALTQLKGGYGNLQDVNEFSNQYAYERDNSKKAPHNLFTTAERFWNYITGKNWHSANIHPYLVFASNLPTGTPVTTITIPYDPAEYKVRYDWRSNEKIYLRAVGGNTQLEAGTKEPLKIKNVIVMLTDITPMPKDPDLKVNITTIGSGKILLFSNGQQYQGYWSKPTITSQLSFTDAKGNPLPLLPGNTWISVLDSSMEKLIQTKPNYTLEIIP